MITVEQVSKLYGAFTAVRDLSFAVPAGSVCGFLGPNGAGKTTTIRMLAGAIRPTSGKLAVAGVDVVTDPRESCRRLGYLPETNPLPSELTVREYMRFRADLWGVEASRRRGAIAGVIDQCGLGEVQRKLIGSLSRGYRQRCGLAAALVASPAVVILDEPGTGLDPETAISFRGLVRSLRGERTVLFSSHNLAEVEATCDHLVLIARGGLVAEGGAVDLRSKGAVGSRFEIESTACDLATIRSVVGVVGVRTESLPDGWIRIWIELEAGVNLDSRQGISTAIGSALHVCGATVRRFQRVNPSLEEIFQRLVQVTEMDHAGGVP